MANDRGVAPKDDLSDNPARWAGIGKPPGALPLKLSFKSVRLLSLPMTDSPGFMNHPFKSAPSNLMKAGTFEIRDSAPCS